MKKCVFERRLKVPSDTGRQRVPGFQLATSCMPRNSQYTTVRIGIL